MKHYRFWLLLLLAVVLPVRGALAAAMLCPPAGVGMQNEVQLLDHHAGHHGMMDESLAVGVLDHGAHHDGSANVDDDGTSASAQDKCNLCSAFCSATPLLSSLPPSTLPQDPVATVFPDLFAPAPSFLSDGQERPPRSI